MQSLKIARAVSAILSPAWVDIFYGPLGGFSNETTCWANSGHKAVKQGEHFKKEAPVFLRDSFARILTSLLWLCCKFKHYSVGRQTQWPSLLLSLEFSDCILPDGTTQEKNVVCSNDLPKNSCPQLALFLTYFKIYLGSKTHFSGLVEAVFTFEDFRAWAAEMSHWL